MSDVGFVFLPGGAMSAWVWRDLDADIRSRSVLVEGRITNNTAERRRSATLSDCVDHVQTAVHASGLQAFVIVAHSGAGALAPLMAKRMKEKVRGIIFVSANIPPNGSTVQKMLPLPIRVLNAFAVRMQLRHDSTPARGREKQIRAMFCNTASQEVVDYVSQQSLLSEPLCVLRESVDWSGVPKIPMTYVRLLHDKTASLELQNRMAANLGIHDFYDIDSDHMVMLSHPAEFNAALRSITKRFCDTWADRR